MALPEIIQKLLESGVHFGHLSKHWNPKMKRFIFGKKKNIYIIDLEKTADCLQKAKDFMAQVAEKDGKILFIATKKQLKGTIESFSVSCGMPYIVNRWIGGFLTNFATVSTRIQKFIQLKEQKEKGEFGHIRSKEKLILRRQLEKMEKNYHGVIGLDSLPDCVYIIDPKREIAAVREAKKLSIPIVALVDTDSDPDPIDYPIPGNDDALKSVNCITASLVEAVVEASKKAQAVKAQIEKELASTKLDGEDNLEKIVEPEQ